MSPIVRVPVLSVQMTVVEPSVSTAASFRSSACRRAMRITPSDSATVTTAGKPSGTAATARLIDVRKSSAGAVPRISPRPNSNPTMPSVAQSRIRPNESSFRCNGVVSSAPALVIRPAIWPSSVRIAVATTTASPVPAATLVPTNTMFTRSPSGVLAFGKSWERLETAAASPVSAASRSRASAATRSPASKIKMSPTTRSVAAIVAIWPSRRTRACGAVSLRSAATEVSALNSW